MVETPTYISSDRLRSSTSQFRVTNRTTFDRESRVTNGTHSKDQHKQKPVSEKILVREFF